MKRHWIALVAVLFLAGCETAADRAALMLRQGTDGYVYAGFGIAFERGVFGMGVTPGTAILARIDAAPGTAVRLPSKSSGGRLGKFVPPGSYRLIGLEITLGETVRQLQIPDSDVVTVGERDVVDLGRYEIRPGEGQTWVIRNQSLFEMYRADMIGKTPEIGLRMVYKPLYP